MRQRMILRHQQAVMPAEPGESRQRRIVAQALAGDADIRSAVMQQRFDFLRGTLHQLDANI